MKAYEILTVFRLVLLFVVTSFCGQVSASPQLNHEIIFAVGQAPLNLDPRYATDAASERVNRLVYQSLVDFDAQSKPVASLASWVTVSPTEYRFTLNKNRSSFNYAAKFLPALLTANDVKLPMIR